MHIELTRSDKTPVLVNTTHVAYYDPAAQSAEGKCFVNFDNSGNNYFLVKESLAEIAAMIPEAE